MHTDNCINDLSEELTYSAPHDCTSPGDHESAPNRCPECGTYMNPAQRMMSATCLKCVKKAHKKAIGR